MKVFRRILGPAVTAAAILTAAGAQAGSHADPLLSGFVAGFALGSAVTMAPPPPQPVYVYPAQPYWTPAPRAAYAYHNGAWHEQPYAEDDDDADDDGE